jgi:hypothetical protein
MQLTFDRSLGDPSPAVTSHHEMVHKDLTESTVGGYLDRFLSSSGTVRGLASEAKETIENWVDGLVQRSMLTHEGTALFISLAQPALFGVPHLDQILAAIPEDYFAFLRTIESRLISIAELRSLHLDIDDALSFNVGIFTIASSIASLALDHIYSPTLDNADVAGVQTVLNTLDADARFKVLLRCLDGHAKRLIQDSVQDAQSAVKELTSTLDIVAHKQVLEELGEKCRGAILALSPKFQATGKSDRPRTCMKFVSSIDRAWVGRLHTRAFSALAAEPPSDVNPPVDLRAAEPGSFQKQWFRSAPPVVSPAETVWEWLRAIVEMGFSSHVVHTIHCLTVFNFLHEPVLLPSGVNGEPMTQYCHTVRSILPYLADGSEIPDGHRQRAEKAIAGSVFATLDDTLSALRGWGVLADQVCWHFAMPYLERSSADLETRGNAYVELANLTPQPIPGLVLFHMDEAGSANMQAVAAILGRTPPGIEVYRSTLLSGDLTPLVVIEKPRPRRWVALTSMYASLKMVREIFGRKLDGKRAAQALGGGSADDPLARLALDFVYVQRWWDHAHE